MADDERILVRRAGVDEQWITPTTMKYEDEKHLQRILAADPGRIPGVNPKATAVSELLTTGGKADVCAVDLDGSITVVECKLASSWEKRRTVIGQVVDYAAAIWMDGDAAFFRAWEKCGGAKLEEFLDAETLALLKRNIAEARINLCLAVDSIDHDLRRLVEYLNEVTRDHVRVTALQLAYARHDDLEMLIPSTFGGEIAAAKARSSRGPTVLWTRETFMDALGTEDDRQLAEQYLERLESLDERLGDQDLVAYGPRSNGLDLHPYGLRLAPVQLWVNAKKHLVIFGNWRTHRGVAGHDAFAGLASLLRQDHTVGSNSVRANSLEIERVWPEVLRCARAINGVEDAETGGPPPTTFTGT